MEYDKIFSKLLNQSAFKERLDELEESEQRLEHEILETNDIVNHVKRTCIMISEMQKLKAVHASNLQRFNKFREANPSKSKDKILSNNRQGSSKKMNTSKDVSPLHKDISAKNYNTTVVRVDKSRDHSGNRSAKCLQTQNSEILDVRSRTFIGKDKGLEPIKEQDAKGFNSTFIRDRSKDKSKEPKKDNKLNITPIDNKPIYKKPGIGRIEKKPLVPDKDKSKSKSKTPDKNDRKKSPVPMRTTTPIKDQKVNQIVTRLYTTETEGSKIKKKHDSSNTPDGKLKQLRERDRVKPSNLLNAGNSTTLPPIKQPGVDLSISAANFQKNLNLNESKTFDTESHKEKEINISSITHDNRSVNNKSIDLGKDISQIMVSGKNSSISKYSPNKDEKKENESINTQETQVDIGGIFEDQFETISSFLNRADLSKLLLLFNKKLVRLDILAIQKSLQKEIVLNEEKIKMLRERSKPEDLKKPFGNFVISRGAIKAVDLLNDADYSSVFNEYIIPKDEIVITTYKIYFQLIKHTEIIATFYDKNLFWKKACEYFSSNPDEGAGTLINESAKRFDFSNENIYKISKLIGNNTTKLVPTYFASICGTTGLIIYLIKDALEYAGLSFDKKVLPARVYSNLHYFFQVLTKKLERVKTISV